MALSETRTTPEETVATVGVADTPIIKRLRPRVQYRVGRHLAFTFGDDSLQMAAALHLGPRIRLLDVTKHYFSARDLSSPDRREQLLRQEIRQYTSQFGGRRPTISLTLTGPQTALRTVTLPWLTKREFETALTFEAGRQLPFRIEDCWIDYRITEIIRRGKNRQVRAAVLAATRVAVQELLTPFDQSGVDVNRVYHTQDSIGQLLRFLTDFDDDRNYMLVDVHRRRTEISYFHGDNLQFYHISSLGSSFFANRTGPTAFEYFAESLATELQNSLDYYGGQFAGPAAQEIYIYGDLSYTDELIALLTERMGFTFRCFPTERLRLTKNRDLPFEKNLAVCLPAVAAAVSQTRIADLLPYPLKAREKRRIVDRAGIAAIMLVALVLGLHWLSMAFIMSSERTQLIELRGEINKFQTSDMFATYSRVKTRVAANQTYLENTRENPSLLALNLKELSHLVPAPVRLNTLEFTDAVERNMQMSGVITTNDTPPEVVLAELVENLASSPFYGDVQVDHNVKRRKDNQSQLEFSLSMKGRL
ncbi:MAG: pilus assembly protein PilM [candidate division Zixibacteria bacterium]|nr:pilus assembly protein PilM [candidate division Zixibacteria bacterium]